MLDNRVGNFVYKINICLLSLIFAFAPAYVFAAYDIPPKPSWLSPSDWRFEKMRLELDALSADINATREKVINGKKVPVKSTAIARIDTSHLVKNINRVGAVGAVSLAITGLIGAVDYVLDPANNRVKYFSPLENNPSNGQYIYTFNLVSPSEIFYDLNTLCERAKIVRGWTDPSLKCVMDLNQQGVETNTIVAKVTSGSYGTIGYRSNNQNYDPNPKTEEKYLPYDTVAAEIAKNAAAGDAAATEFVADTISNELDNNPNMRKDIQDQLDRNEQVGPDDEPETPPDPNNPPDPNAPPTNFKLPAFCTWAAFLCSTQIDIRTNTKKTVEQLEKQSPDIATTAQETTKTREELEKQTEQDKTFYEKVTAWFDWTQKDDSDSDQGGIEKEYLDIETQPDTNRVQFGSNCPAPLQGSYSMLGRTFSVEYSWEPACEVASNFKPAVVGCAGLAAIYIVLGINRKTED